MPKFVTPLDMSSNKIIDVTDPTAAQDAATKNYADGILILSHNKRVQSFADLAGITPDFSAFDGGIMPACSQALTIRNPSGPIAVFHTYILRLTTVVSQGITWDTQYRGSILQGLPPTTTGGGATDYFGFQWNEAASRVDLLAYNFGF